MEQIGPSFLHHQVLLPKVDQLMALCNELEAGLGAGANRGGEVDGGCCASCAGGVIWEYSRVAG